MRVGGIAILGGLAAGRFGMELDGILPVAGTSRFDAGALLRAAYRFD